LLATWDSINTVADGLRTSRIGQLNLATILETVDDIVTVSDDEILSTVGLLATGARLVAEPSGATAAAAVLFDRVGLGGMRTVAVVSGGNIAPEVLAQCILRTTSTPAGISA
jgi:threonine dehydratase